MTTTDELIFEDPPYAARGPQSSSPIKPWLDRLRDNPGKWARYPEPFAGTSGNAVAFAIRGGQRYRLTAGEFDAVTRTIDGSKYLYARYVGGES